MGSDSAKAERFWQHLEPLQAALEAFCRRSLHDPQAVEDTLHNALTDAFRDFHLYAENTNFRAWIFRYLNLEILEQNRRTAKESTVETPGSDATDPASNVGPAACEALFAGLPDNPEAVLEQCDGLLADAIGQLTDRDRSVLLLRAIGDFKYAEIAEILQVPAGTVMSSLARSRQRLRQRLAKHGRRRGLSGDGG